MHQNVELGLTRCTRQRANSRWTSPVTVTLRVHWSVVTTSAPVKQTTHKDSLQVQSHAMNWGPEWISTHQCTSWPFYPPDGLRFFIRRQMGFMTVHFFLLLTIVLFFFLVLARFSLDLTSHIATLLTFLPCSLFYLATVLTTYPTNLATVLITYPTNLATVLTTYPTNLATLLITYPTLNAIPAFWAISKVRMWGSSFLYTKILP
jgi:hypothetical protein